MDLAFRECIIFERSAFLTVVLLAAIGLVGVEVYEVWHNPTPLFEPVIDLVPPAGPPGRALPQPPGIPGVSTRTIVARNLFDPDRGAKVEEPPEPVKVEEEPEQSIDGLLLLGTVIAGSERYAIMQVPPDPGPVSASRRGRITKARTKRPAVVPRGTAVRRVRVGDSLRGYQVKDIEEQKVVLARGAAQTEVTIDYTREIVAPKKPQLKKKTRPQSRKRPVRSRRTRRKPAR